MDWGAIRTRFEGWSRGPALALIVTLLALRATILLAGYGAMLALFARTDTFYWALLAAPLSFAGLAFLPKALSDLAKAVRKVPSHRAVQDGASS
jgi:hypothetical protein